MYYLSGTVLIFGSFFFFAILVHLKCYTSRVSIARSFQYKLYYVNLYIMNLEANEKNFNKNKFLFALSPGWVDAFIGRVAMNKSWKICMYMVEFEIN